MDLLSPGVKETGMLPVPTKWEGYIIKKSTQDCIRGPRI